MRMATLHLGDEAPGKLLGRERAPLLGEHGVEEHLEQQVAQLFPKLRVASGADRVVDLVCFLDQVWTKRLVRLRGVPIAARAQVAHESERIFKRRFHLPSLLGSDILPAL